MMKPSPFTSKKMMTEDQNNNKSAPEKEESTETLKLMVGSELSRAFHRCTWVLMNETGRNQQDIMEEAVRDFLVKHGC